MAQRKMGNSNEENKRIKFSLQNIVFLDFCFVELLLCKTQTKHAELFIRSRRSSIKNKI